MVTQHSFAIDLIKFRMFFIFNLSELKLFLVEVFCNCTPLNGIICVPHNDIFDIYWCLQNIYNMRALLMHISNAFS